MLHAVTLLLVLVAAAPLARFIPMAVLAAILFVVAWNMGEWHEISQLLKQTKTDISVWLVTFTLTVVADLTLAVEVGMILAALLYIRRVSSTTTVSMVTSDYIEAGRPHILQDKAIPSYVAIFRIHGPLLFGVTDKLAAITDHLERLPPIVIVRLRNMTALDATGIKALEEVADRVKSSGRTILFCGAREQPSNVMRQTGFDEYVGPGNVCPTILHALRRAEQIHKVAAA
jgi:SulP family sulfate permease